MAAGNHTESLNFIHGRFVCGVSNDNDLLGWAILPFLSAITISYGRSVYYLFPQHRQTTTSKAIISMIRVSQSFRVLSDSAQIYS